MILSPALLLLTKLSNFIAFAATSPPPALLECLKNSPMEIKKAFSFLPGFLECHPSWEVLEVDPGGTWEGGRHLPKLLSHPRAPAKGKAVAQPMW